jgi:hypothetical protein
MKSFLAVILCLACSVAVGEIPYRQLDIDANWQQLQRLPTVQAQQGADYRLMVRPKVDGKWLNLTNVTATFAARATMTSTNYYGASSTWTSNALHQIAIDLDSNQTGTALTNWVYVIALLSGGGTYPIGTGRYDVAASTFTGAGTLLTDTNQWATRVYVDAQIAALPASTGTVSSITIDGSNYTPVAGIVTLPAIAGPAGADGADGTNGAPGAAGSNGVAGATGPAGSNANVRVVAGTGGVTVTPATNGLVVTYTVSDDDAGGVTAAQATNIAAAVVAPYTNHQSRTDNPHAVTAAQVGAVATNDAAYLAALTNAQFAAQDGVTIVGRTLNIGTNLLGGTTGGGTLQDAVTAGGGTPVTNVPALTLASGAALSMSGTLSAQGGMNNVGLNAGAGASGDLMHNWGFFAGAVASGDYMHNVGASAGASASGDYMHNVGHFAGANASGDYMHNWGFYAGNYGNATNAHSIGPWAGRNAAGSNPLYIGAHAADPGAGWNPTNDQIYVDGNTGDMSLGTTNSTNHIRSKWIFDSADLAFFGAESLADYVAAHGGGGGTSLVIEASSSIAVATSGVTRTLSVKTGVFQPTNSTLTTLAAGTATPILGTSATTAAAGDVPATLLDLAGTRTMTGTLKTGGYAVLGGAATNSLITIQGTSGNGTLTMIAGQLACGNNGATKALTWLNNGNVGIGTEAPVQKLEVNGSLYLSTAANPSIRIDTSLSQKIYLTIGNGTSSLGSAMKARNWSAGSIVQFELDGAPLLLNSQTGSGNVGIGTNAPACKIHLAGANAVACIENNSTTNNPATRATAAKLWVVAGELKAMDGSGNVATLTPDSAPDESRARKSSVYNVYTGKGHTIDLVALADAVQTLTGRKDIITEFDVPKADWDTEQTAEVAATEAKISAWMSDANAVEVKGEKPSKYTAKPKPKWLTDALQAQEVKPK